MKTLFILAILTLNSTAMAQAPNLKALQQNEQALAAAEAYASSASSAAHINHTQKPEWKDPWATDENPPTFWNWSSRLGEPVLFTDIFAPPEQLQIETDRFIVEAMYFCPTQ